MKDLPATAHSFRPASRATPPASAMPVHAAPPWPTARPNVPTIYFTLGTVFNMESGDLFTRVVTGLRELPVNILVTVGPHIDPAERGVQPAHVRIERFIAQELVMPYCGVVVSHGGSGSVTGALAHGLPSVLMPMGADQSRNAVRCVQLGVACVLDPVVATAESVRDAAAAVLADGSFRRAAERIRDDFATLPGPMHAVRLLERLVAEKRPIISAQQKRSA